MVLCQYKKRNNSCLFTFSLWSNAMLCSMLYGTIKGFPSVRTESCWGGGAEWFSIVRVLHLQYTWCRLLWEMGYHVRWTIRLLQYGVSWVRYLESLLRYSLQGLGTSKILHLWVQYREHIDVLATADNWAHVTANNCDTNSHIFNLVWMYYGCLRGLGY